MSITATARRLGNVDVKGGLWGPDLLAAIANGHSSVPGDTIAAESYGLPARASTEHTARNAWTLLSAAWEEFSDHHTHHTATVGTDTYGTDTFTWEKWTRHLLAQLGYAPEPAPAGGLSVDNADPNDPGDHYPITHLHHDQVPLHILPAGVSLDTRTPGVTGAARQSPHSLLQDYLNRASAHLWGIVTNGLTLRILRNNAALSRQAYIEFDLVGIFEDSAYADFALLWHAVHASRFVHPDDNPPSSCTAERWQDHAEQTGVAALDDLRYGVEAAIAAIGQGLLQHPANTTLRDLLADPDSDFDAAVYYRELLYIVYRHVFWFTLDDRNLLHPDTVDHNQLATYRTHYSSTVLRDKARRHRGATHPDGWQHFATITGWFADPAGCPPLAIPALMGQLWDPDATQHLNGTTLENRHYYEAIRQLAYVQRNGTLHRINYDAMGSEELGAVYESLLEIRPEADPEHRTFQLGRTDGSDRKKTGSYYTPTSLIKILLDEALDPVLDQRITTATQRLPEHASAEQRQSAQERAVLATTVCDPAMGSAHFLVAAGMRIAKRLATVRTGELEPSPEVINEAFRDVASHCLYGVDVNPMAVELAKVAIWLECHVPGQPLTFLDHHLTCGNALLGVGFDTDLIAWHKTAGTAAEQKGIPDAAFKPLAGDDKQHARRLRDLNKDLRGRAGQLTLESEATHIDNLDKLADTAAALDALEDTTPDGLVTKQQTYTQYLADPERTRQQMRADAWMTSWTLPKTEDATARYISDNPLAGNELPWDLFYDTFSDDELTLERPAVQLVDQHAATHRFFHWYLEFPDVAANGGFHLMLGNPPWERIKLQEKEWFAAAGYDDVAHAANAAARKRAITALAQSDDPVDRATATRWQRDSRTAQALSEFARVGNRFPLGGVGDVNTYALFTDHFLHSVAGDGRIGIIVPTGLITDYTYRDLFATLVEQRRLAVAYDFQNRRQLFPEVTTLMRFTTLVLTAPHKAAEARFAFMVHDPAELDDPDRSYALTPEQIELVNPNTKTAPVFLTPRDAEITTKIYEQHPVLINHNIPDGNPWGVKFMRMFDMANDSHLFHTKQQLEADGWELNGNIFHRGDEQMLPLYEAKMFHHFNHRWATYVDDTTSRDVTHDELADPTYEPLPRYWVAGTSVAEKLADKGWDHDLLLSWRDICRATDARTCVAAAIPRVAAPDGSLLALPEKLAAVPLLAACWSSFAFDFVVRQKSSGTHLKFYTFEQLPVLIPSTLSVRAPWDGRTQLANWVAARSVALAGTSHVLASALGASEPIRWDAPCRDTWRTELDAAMFHLYGYSRDDVEYVMDTFPIVARQVRKSEGLAPDDPNWKTKRLILAKYDELARCAEAGVPYESPVSPPPLPESFKPAFREFDTGS